MVRTRFENHNAIGFLINTGPDPIKNHKATKPAFNDAKWCFACGPKMAPLSVVFRYSLPSSTKKKRKKKNVRVEPHSDKTLWIRAWYCPNCSYILYTLSNQEET